MDVLREFQKALQNEEFKVYYQPKVSLKRYNLAGAEALCRWVHDGKIISPDDFIPILEKGSEICQLDFYMFEHICRDIQNWYKENRRVVKISMNLSRRHLGDPELLHKIISIIDKYHVNHSDVEIELTETTTDVDYSELKKIVKGLSAEGIVTSVDDFGIGYSSMNLIKELPWNVLKIDKSFLPTEKTNDRKNMVMFRHLLSLGQDLGLDCIVEGVETAEQVRLLKENNCFLAQGFYFDKPMPEREFVKRMAQR